MHIVLIYVSHKNTYKHKTIHNKCTQLNTL